jgi:N-acetyl-gamma-glutamyl-phosphate reductase
VSDNFKAYGIKSHRHTIEIQETLEGFGEGIPQLQFTPHLLPVDRGILSTAYAHLPGFSAEKLKALYSEFYSEHPFVRMVDEAPSIKDVRASNYCNIYTDYDERTGNTIVISVIDNLVKGAAGQAVHNFNFMFGIEEKSGLHHIPINP